MTPSPHKTKRTGRKRPRNPAMLLPSSLRWKREVSQSAAPTASTEPDAIAVKTTTVATADPVKYATVSACVRRLRARM